MDEIFDITPCGFLIFTDSGQLMQANAMLLELLGYEREELLSLPIEKIFSLPGRIFYQTHFFPLLKLQAQVKEVYFSLRSKTGQEIPVLANAARHEREGVILNYCVFIEMRQRDEYENELIEARKEAEAAALARDQFLHVVSHELRAPLNAILGWTGMIESGMLDEEGLQRGTQAIKRSAKAQSQLIEDILDYARITSGKMQLELNQIDPAKIISEAIEIVTPAAEAKNIRLETNFEAETLVSGDPTRLQQVLWNILLNAIKFTPKGGLVQIKLERVNSHIDISVKDNGKGISPEFLPFVFERLRQADTNQSKRSGGLGLGMAISRHIIELHGGTIRAQSEGEGLGATFTISLPVRIIQEREINSTSSENNNFIDENLKKLAQAPRLNGLHILIVDDQSQARDLLRTVLTTQGARVTAAANVKQAVEEFQATNFDLVISDIEMPDEDGFSLIEKLNAFNKDHKRKTPAIALTGQVSSAERIKILTAGYQLHIPKPIEPIELITAAANIIGLIKPELD